jgi:hypothetical protein
MTDDACENRKESIRQALKSNKKLCYEMKESIPANIKIRYTGYRMRSIAYSPRQIGLGYRTAKFDFNSEYEVLRFFKIAFRCIRFSVEGYHCNACSSNVVHRTEKRRKCRARNAMNNKTTGKKKCKKSNNDRSRSRVFFLQRVLHSNSNSL